MAEHPPNGDTHRAPAAHEPLSMKTDATAFFRRATKPSDTECWRWLGYKTPLGYGGVGIGGKTMRAHRVAYELVKGPIPRGMMVCHSCDVRDCVNPEHLFLGTQADNMQDMRRKGRSAPPEQTANRGRKNGSAKLRESQVREIRSSVGSQSQIAASYGVSQMTVSCIKRGVRWASLQ